jgi:hypothetical protein
MASHPPQRIFPDRAVQMGIRSYGLAIDAYTCVYKVLESGKFVNLNLKTCRINFSTWCMRAFIEMSVYIFVSIRIVLCFAKNKIDLSFPRNAYWNHFVNCYPIWRKTVRSVYML